MLKPIMRIFSYLYHLVFGLFLFGIASLSLFAGGTLDFDMLPWEGAALAYWLLFSSLAGLISLLLAVKGKLQLLFRLWTLAVLVMMAYGFFFTRYGFNSAGHFWNSVLLTLGALAAAAGSLVKAPRSA